MLHGNEGNNPFFCENLRMKFTNSTQIVNKIFYLADTQSRKNLTKHLTNMLLCCIFADGKKGKDEGIIMKKRNGL